MASLQDQTGNSGAASGDTYVEVEGLMLTSSDDVGIGEGGANYLYGLAGSDTLYGRDGMDVLFGGDSIDYFAFDAAAINANADVVADFVSGIDKIALSLSIYGANQTTRFDAGTSSLFWEGASNATANDDVLIAILSGVSSVASSDVYFY